MYGRMWAEPLVPASLEYQASDAREGGIILSEALPRINPISPEYVTRKVFPAGDWALDEVTSSRAVVGNGQRILWAKGETLFVVGDTGHGKSTLTQNTTRANIGLIPDILGFEAISFRSVLYIAADRPAQIKASLRRMVDDTNRQIWNGRVAVHEGPPGFALNDEPFKFLPFIRELAEQMEREPFDCVICDSLKDMVSQMDENTDGIHINQALQSVCQQDIQVLVDIHPRKMGSSRDKERSPVLDDVGGNKNITAGAGSVLYIGAPTEGSHPLYHLKSPSERIEGLSIRYDNPTGNITYKEWGL